MYSKEKLSEIIEEHITGLSFPSDPSALYEPISYALERGGKRIRPLLTMMACNIFSEAVEKALPCASAIEVFHNFTLLHDDIMDNASVRRGKPSVHRRWGANAAILSGDAMMIYAYTLLESVDPAILPDVLRVFNSTSMKVCEGQQYDMDFESCEAVSMEEYLKMISLKTAVLLAGATIMGAMVGGASAEDIGRLETFAMELGMAFQIQDDLLDTYGTPEVLGKKIGGDILEGKKTFLTIAAIEVADDSVRVHLSELLHDREIMDKDKITEVRAIYDSLGVKQRAIEAVTQHTARAVAALESIVAPVDRLDGMKQLALSLNRRIS